MVVRGSGKDRAVVGQADGAKRGPDAECEVIGKVARGGRTAAIAENEDRPVGRMGAQQGLDHGFERAFVDGGQQLCNTGEIPPREIARRSSGRKGAFHSRRWAATVSALEGF